jgi:hypothetical protein
MTLYYHLSHRENSVKGFRSKTFPPSLTNGLKLFHFKELKWYCTFYFTAILLMAAPETSAIAVPPSITRTAPVMNDESSLAR